MEWGGGSVTGEKEKGRMDPSPGGLAPNSHTALSTHKAVQRASHALQNVNTQLSCT